MHPIDPYLDLPLSRLEELWICVAFSRCERAGCVACTYVPIRMALREERARPDALFQAFLRRIVCKTCRGQPARLALCERADGKGWTLDVPPARWRRAQGSAGSA